MGLISGTARATCGGTVRAMARTVDRGNTTLLLAAVGAYDVANATLTTLYYGSSGFVTEPLHTPASTFFDARIRSCNISRSLFSPGTTGGESRTASGDLVLANNDGALDGLLAYAFDGRDVVVYQGAKGDAFPSGFTVLFRGTMDQPELTRNDLILRLRDRQYEMDVPLTTTLYDGDNALPAGLEGVDDLKGKPKPVLLGSFRNISPPCVNTAKLIYQVADGAVTSIPDVRDSGITLAYTLRVATRASSPGFPESVT